MVVIQMYAKLKDLTPTEPNQLTYQGYFNDPDEEIMLEYDMDCIKTYAEDIKLNGMKYAIQINAEGTILDGNCRYWCARELGWVYVPINRFKLGDKYYPKPEVI